MAALDDVESRVNQCADTILKASNMAYDTVRHFGNMQQVVSTGKAGALALADTLAAAPVGDAAQVRVNINAQEAGKCIENEEQVKTAGLSGGDLARPYFRKTDGNVCWIQPATSMMALGLGGEAWQVRQRIGLGNDESGRSALGLGAGDTVTLHGVNVTTLSFSAANGNWSIGAVVMAACYTNANIGFNVTVPGTDLRPCSTTGWIKDDFRLNGNWQCASQVAGRYDLYGSGSCIGLWRRVS